MTDRRRVRVIVLASALALGPSVMPDSASPQPADADQEPFRVEWEPQLLGGHDPALKGYVENRTQMRITDVRLRVEALDGSGTVVGQSFGWVFGDVPASGRAYFVVPLAATGAAYRVSVMSYDLGARGPVAPGSPSASP